MSLNPALDKIPAPYFIEQFILQIVSSNINNATLIATSIESGSILFTLFLQLNFHNHTCRLLIFHMIYIKGIFEAIAYSTHILPSCLFHIFNVCDMIEIFGIVIHGKSRSFCKVDTIKVVTAQNRTLFNHTRCSTLKMGRNIASPCSKTGHISCQVFLLGRIVEHPTLNLIRILHVFIVFIFKGQRLSTTSNIINHFYLSQSTLYKDFCAFSTLFGSLAGRINTCSFNLYQSRHVGIPSTCVILSTQRRVAHEETIRVEIGFICLRLSDECRKVLIAHPGDFGLCRISVCHFLFRYRPIFISPHLYLITMLWKTYITRLVQNNIGPQVRSNIRTINFLNDFSCRGYFILINQLKIVGHIVSSAELSIVCIITCKNQQVSVLYLVFIISAVFIIRAVICTCLRFSHLIRKSDSRSRHRHIQRQTDVALTLFVEKIGVVSTYLRLEDLVVLPPA